MKSFYTLLLASMVSLSVSAQNVDADKVRAAQNKALRDSLSKATEVLAYHPDSIDLRLKKAAKYKLLSKKQLELVDVVRSMSHQILQHNERAANMKIQAAYALIGDVEGQKLDQQQMTCIVKEAVPEQEKRQPLSAKSSICLKRVNVCRRIF